MNGWMPIISGVKSRKVWPVSDIDMLVSCYRLADLAERKAYVMLLRLAGKIRQGNALPTANHRHRWGGNALLVCGISPLEITGRTDRAQRSVRPILGQLAERGILRLGSANLAPTIWRSLRASLQKTPLVGQPNLATFADCEQRLGLKR